MKTISILLFLFLAQNSFSQLSLSDTTRRVPFDTNKIKEAVYLSNTSEVFSYDSLYIWSDKRSLSEVMDERPGYFINDFGLGGRNDINHGVSLSREIGIFRDGIQINDNFFQAFDIQNISINEIDKIEEISTISSFYYGINSGGKAINVITKDYFQPKPFSQLRYSQDREGSLFADVIFNQPVSRKLDVQLGVTKHSMDGRYENSAFDVWRGRARVNLYLSPKFNAKFNFYLDNFEREINDGLVYNPDKNILLDPSEAQVVNPSAHEKLVNYYYDATLTGRFFKDKNSLTKLKIYSSNSIRDLTNILGDTLGIFSLKSGSVHSIQYSADLSQNVFIKHGRYSSSDISGGGNIYLNYFNTTYYGVYEPKYYSLKAKYDFRYKGLLVSSMIRNDNLDSKNFLNLGVESKFDFDISKDLKSQLNGGINKLNYTLFNQLYDPNQLNLYENSRTNYSIGAKIIYKDLSLYANFIIRSDENSIGYSDAKSMNGGLFFENNFVSINSNINGNNSANFPYIYVKSDIAYKGLLFNGKLKLKTGFNLKYYNIKKVVENFQTSYSWSYPDPYFDFPQQNQFIVDFYIGARIGRANINLTLANLFNSLVYNSYLFPLDDRGGFGNVVSRFTIVWDFIN